MKKNNAAVSVSATLTQELNDLIIDAIQDIKGKNIIKLDLTDLEDAPADFFIVCEGESNTQIQAISNNVMKRVRNELGVRASHSEGDKGSHWVLVDFFDTVVHVFYPQTRKFYDIEDLWSDAQSTEYQNL